jgi:hypothetical protein
MFDKLMILVVILACIGPFFIKGPDGEPLMKLADWLPADVPDPPAREVRTTVYKWQDEHGVWHFSNDPVEGAGMEGVEDVEVMELDGRINTMEAFRAPVQSPNPADAVAVTATANLPPGILTVAPDKVAEMMDTVTHLQQTVDQRKADMDKAIQQQR